MQTAAVTGHSSVQRAYIYKEMTTSVYRRINKPEIWLSSLQTKTKHVFPSSKTRFSVNYADPYMLVPRVCVSVS